MKENYAFYAICFYLIMMLLHALCLYMYTLKEYAELCKHCELSALHSVAYIKRSLFEKFCGT